MTIAEFVGAIASGLTTRAWLGTTRVLIAEDVGPGDERPIIDPLIMRSHDPYLRRTPPSARNTARVDPRIFDKHSARGRKTDLWMAE